MGNTIKENNNFFISKSVMKILHDWIALLNCLSSFNKISLTMMILLLIFIYFGVSGHSSHLVHYLVNKFDSVYNVNEKCFLK